MKDNGIGRALFTSPTVTEIVFADFIDEVVKLCPATSRTSPVKPHNMTVMRYFIILCKIKQLVQTILFLDM